VGDASYGPGQTGRVGIVHVLIETHTPAPGDDPVQSAVNLVETMKAKLIPEGRALLLIDAQGPRVAGS